MGRVSPLDNVFVERWKSSAMVIEARKEKEEMPNTEEKTGKLQTYE